MLKFMVRFLLILLLLALILVYLHPKLLGFYLEPKLERVLTGLFDMPVTISHLEGNLLTGHVKASRITFMNQPEFAPAPHFDAVKGLEFDIDYRALKNKEVLIKNGKFYELFYLIDRIASDQGAKNNVSTWVYHIRYGRHKNKKPEQKPAAEPKKESSQSPQDKKRWHVKIDSIEIKKGTFIFDDRSGEMNNRFVFNGLEGLYSGFEWPSPNPGELSQTVELKGTIGEKYPAPFRAGGRANFATGQINFDLSGEIKDGIMAEYQRFWEGLPIFVEEGKFHLKLRLICLRRRLKSKSLLKLHDMKITSLPTVPGKIWGLPFLASLSFLQQQKEIHLRVPVNGVITDPQFHFPKAFRDASQAALRQHTINGIKLLTFAPAKIVTGTQEIAMKTPAAIAESFEKIVSKIEGNAAA